jgi:small multidrug resistance pump/quaternary ammonium compound-resistance protein SugE
MPVGAALSFTVGGVFMELSNGLSRPFASLMVYLMFGLGASLQALATQNTGMGITYILVLGLEAVLAVLFSAVLFREDYSALKLVGVFLVAVGITFLRSGNA